MKALWKLVYSQDQYVANSQPLKKAILQLPADNQIVIQLHFVQSLSRKEIAKKLNWSLSKVNNKINRGITLLKAELNPEHFRKMDMIITDTTQLLLRK